MPLGGLGEETAGFKGYGYATFVEILSAALQDGRYLKQLLGVEDGKPAPYRLGHFFLAIDIEHFVPLAVFRGIAGNITRALRGSEKAPGAERIYTAWEKEHERFLERSRAGVPLEPSVQAEMTAMRTELGLRGHSFPWD